MTNETFTQSLLFTGYKDYIAARLLINSGEIIQGLTLASSAVEKYIKAYLVAVGKKPNQVHLNNFKELKKQFGQNYSDILDKLDKQFLGILGKAYDYRYFDKKTKIDYIGLSVNQILAELDFTVDFFEDQIEIFDINTNVKLDTWYHMNLKGGNKILSENNYIIEGVSKKEFMERPSRIYSLRISPENPTDQVVFEIMFDNHELPYEGEINTEIRIRKVGTID